MIPMAIVRAGREQNDGPWRAPSEAACCSPRRRRVVVPWLFAKLVEVGGWVGWGIYGKAAHGVFEECNGHGPAEQPSCGIGVC